MSSERLQKIRKILEQENSDSFLLINHESSGQPDARYLSSFSGSESMLLITPVFWLILVAGFWCLFRAQFFCGNRCGFRV